MGNDEEEKMRRSIFVWFFLLLFIIPQTSGGEETDWQPGPLAPKTRCPVCGMFVNKYAQWVSRIRLSDGTEHAFDGVKDMMAFYFSPQTFGARAGVTIAAVSVKDYYSLQPLSGRDAFYVLGSDVLGPMGHELIPLASKGAAENFLADHKGEQVLRFAEITPDLIDSLRAGHGMGGKKMRMDK